MNSTVTHPPDATDKEWLDDICADCLRTALCA